MCIIPGDVRDEKPRKLVKLVVLLKLLRDLEDAKLRLKSNGSSILTDISNIRDHFSFTIIKETIKFSYIL